MLKTLYITYDGLLDPLGQTQILPYLEGLAAQHGHQFVILSFEKAARWADVARRQALIERLQRHNFVWLPLHYHQRPTLPATLYDLILGLWTATVAVQRHQIQALHIRSTVPLTLGLLLKRWFKLPLLFDLRGFWADERADLGMPRTGLLYRLLKKLEQTGLNHAEQLVTLTKQSLRYLVDHSQNLQIAEKTSVIPCSANLQRWQRDEQARARIRQELGWQTKQIVVYSGSLGGGYRSNDLAECFATWLQSEPDLRWLVLSNQDPQSLITALHDLNVPAESYTIRSVASNDVAQWLSVADVAISLITPSYAKIASSPTKFGEYLACGLPIFSNAGIGDSQQLFDQGVAIEIADFNRAAYQAAWQSYQALRQQPDLGQRCRDVAASEFDLARAIEHYAACYRELER
ncbi:glycosyltransferase [Herpetosiphon llansteffanensis]